MNNMQTHNNVQTDRLLYLITAVLRDIQAKHSDVITSESLQFDVRKVVRRVSEEGSGFLTKTLPLLGKALDSAFSGSTIVDAASIGFRPGAGKAPLLLGSLWNRVVDLNGKVLTDPCVESIKAIRQFSYLFYKYELPYDQQTEKGVLDSFAATEKEITPISRDLEHVAQCLDTDPFFYEYGRINPPKFGPVIRRARRLLFELFRTFDPFKIVPSHGPGAVSSREQLWEKWEFTKVSPRLIESYPIDAYFFASLSHLGDRPDHFKAIVAEEDQARICLVPKDSRGPRVISCEPLATQFVQQGLRQALYDHIESHPMTRNSVHFTDQRLNQWGAFIGSLTGTYATLDLKDASDRVSVGLVKLLFPQPLLKALLDCRTLSTLMPDGSILPLNKYAPMGSALCFPVLALSCWALIQAVISDADPEICRKALCEEVSDNGVLVYGDDVVVPTAHAADAIEVLEAFGLKVNRNKSFISGLFRESCGLDVFKGVNVTPVKLKTVWSSHRSPEALASWCEYANEFYERGYFYTYEYIAGELFKIYRTIPEKRHDCPSLIEVPESFRPKRRYQASPKAKNDYQRVVELCWTIRPRKVHHVSDGWRMLHRFFLDTYGRKSDVYVGDEWTPRTDDVGLVEQGGRRAKFGETWLSNTTAPYSVCSYTKARSTKLVRRWL